MNGHGEGCTTDFIFSMQRPAAEALALRGSCALDVLLLTKKSFSIRAVRLLNIFDV